MAWVHLATYPIGMPDEAAAWIGEHTRFAAGAFVLLSGMTVRRVFGPALEGGGTRRRDATIRLLRRALLLAIVGRLASIAFFCIEALLRTPGGATSGGLSGVAAIATFAEPGVTGGLLLLYSLLLAATPLLERLRAATGTVQVLLGSFLVFALAQAFGDAWHWPPWTFPFAHWQPLFVLGYLASPHLSRLRDRNGAVSAPWLAATTVGTALLFALRSGPALDLAPPLQGSLGFVKVPLSGGELAWYVAVSAFVLSWSAWMHERSDAVRRGCGWIRRLGQWSLLVYVSQLLLELPILAVLTRFDPSSLVRGTMLVVMAVAMSAVARFAELLSTTTVRGADRRAIPASWRGFLPPAGAAGGMVAVASALMVWTLDPSTAGRAASGRTHLVDGVIEEAHVDGSDVEGLVVEAVAVVDDILAPGAQPDAGLPGGIEPALEPSLDALPIDELPDDENPLPIAH